MERPSNPAELQQRLLALIQTGTFSRLGSSEKTHVDIQVIAATNEDLRDLVQRRRFREDLFRRISVVSVYLPPLSDRAADIPQLARKFLQEACEQFERQDIRGFKDRALHALLNHDWSRAGNIRGLEHTISRSVLLAEPGVPALDAKHLRFQSPFGYGRDERVPAAAEPRPAPRGTGRAPELDAIKSAIREHHYASAAARALGIPRNAMIWQLRKAGLTVRDVLLEGSTPS